MQDEAMRELTKQEVIDRPDTPILTTSYASSSYHGETSWASSDTC